MSTLHHPPSMEELDLAVASANLSTTILLALATALVLPLLLVALGVSVSALWKAIKAELAPVQAPAPRRKKTPKPPKREATASAERNQVPPSSPPPLPPLAPSPAPAPPPVHPAQAVMSALNDPTLQVRVSGLLTRNPPGGGALFRGELMDGSAVAVFAARRPIDAAAAASAAASTSSSSSTRAFSIPPLLGAGAAHPNVAQLFVVRETIVVGGCNVASGALLPPARRGCWGGTSSSSSSSSSSSTTAAAAAAALASKKDSSSSPLSLAAALAAAGAPLPDSSSSSSSPPTPEIETVAVYEFCERGTLRDAIRAWAATAAAAKSRGGNNNGGGVASSSSSSSCLTPFDPSISPAPLADDAHLRVKTLLEVARGLARVHGAGGRPHGALCAENVVLAASDADRRGFVAKLAAFSRPPSAGVGAGVGAGGAAPPGLAPELVEAARIGSGGVGGVGLASLSASELRRRRRLASTSSAEDIDEEVEFSAPLPPWAAPLTSPAAAAAAAARITATPIPTATFEADVYAFGVLAWEVAASADAGLLPPPLPLPTTAAAAAAVAAAASSSSRNAAGDEEALLSSWPCCRALGSLATQCLSPQPRARPSVAQLLRSLAALEERLRADTARSELDYLFAAVNARQAPISSSSSLTPDAPAFEPRVVRAAAPVASAAAASAWAAAAAVPKKKRAEIEEAAAADDGAGGAAARSSHAPRPPPPASSSSSRHFTEDIFFGMPSPPK